MKSSTEKIAVMVVGMFLLGAAAFAADSVVEEIIVRVNNAIITRSEVIKSREQNVQEVHEKMGNGPAADERSRSATATCCAT